MTPGRNNRVIIKYNLNLRETHVSVVSNSAYENGM